MAENTRHSQMAGPEAVHQSAYVQNTDPGAVGALKDWYDTSTTPAVHKVRNATNDGWLLVGVADGTGFDADTVDGAHAANLRDRSTHTGSQSSTTISDFTEAVQDAVAALLTSGSNVTLTYNDAGDTLQISATGGDAETMRDTIGAALVGTGAATVTVNDAADTITISVANATTSVAGLMSAADKTKLDGIESGATADQTAAEIVAAINAATGLAFDAEALSNAPGGGHTIADEGSALTSRATLDFQGAGVTASDDSVNGKTVVTIPGGSGSGVIELRTSDPSSPSQGQEWIRTDLTPVQRRTYIGTYIYKSDLVNLSQVYLFLISSATVTSVAAERYFARQFTPQKAIQVVGFRTQYGVVSGTTATLRLLSGTTTIASVSFVGSGAQQDVSFPSPVALNPGSVYEIGYSSPNANTVKYADSGFGTSNSDIAIGTGVLSTDHTGATARTTNSGLGPQGSLRYVI